MNKELRRTSIAVLLMFLSLFVSVSVIQVVAADELRDDPRNSRTFYANMSVNRGPILVDGVPIAESVRFAGDPASAATVVPQASPGTAASGGRGRASGKYSL